MGDQRGKRGYRNLLGLPIHRPRLHQQVPKVGLPYYSVHMSTPAMMHSVQLVTSEAVDVL